MFLISGNIGKEAEVKTVPSGKIVVEYSVAVYAGKDQQGNSQTLWVKCAHWFNQQPNDYLVPKKGDGVIITGTPAPIELWTSNAGKQGADLKIMVNSIEFTKRGETNQSEAQQRAVNAAQAKPEGATLPQKANQPVVSGPAVTDDDLDNLPF